MYYACFVEVFGVSPDLSTQVRVWTCSYLSISYVTQVIFISLAQFHGGSSRVNGRVFGKSSIFPANVCVVYTCKVRIVVNVFDTGKS